MNWGAFLLDPLNITGIQDTPAPPRGPGAPPAPVVPPPQGLQLDMSNPPPYGVTAGNADGRPERPQAGFLQPMLGNENPFQPSWQYVQGKGPQWQSQDPQGSPAFNAPFKGNRI
jgi:hypothetical protein